MIMCALSCLELGHIPSFTHINSNKLFPDDIYIIITAVRATEFYLYNAL